MRMSADTWVKVTDDPDLDALLWERVDALSSQALAEYAHSLGLFPPGYGPTMNPPIALAWPPGTPDDGDGILVWDIGDDSDQAED
ncbi:hypothetical protein STSO111631_20190 [Stackebrandtia soli]